VVSFVRLSLSHLIPRSNHGVCYDLPRFLFFSLGKSFPSKAGVLGSIAVIWISSRKMV
jgi:hypothetical protein